MVFNRGLLLKGTAALLALSAVATIGLTVFPLKSTSTLGGGISDLSDVKENVALKTLNEQLKELGIKKECYLDREDSEKTCEINKDELKAIRFSNKVEGTDLVIEGLDTAKLNLKIKKAKDTGVFGKGIRFGFEVTGGDVTIKSGVEDSQNPILLKEGTNPEFKRNQDGKLEKAWTVTKLGEKVDLTCPAVSGSNEKKCTIGANKTIKIYENDTTSKDFISASTATENQITYEVDTQNYNQGFKFIVSSDVSGTNSTTLVAGNYEAKYKKESWTLVKKDT